MSGSISVYGERNHLAELLLHLCTWRQVHRLSDVEGDSLLCHAAIRRWHQLYQCVQWNFQPWHILQCTYLCSCVYNSADLLQC